MLEQDQIDELLAGRHADPFALLGLHADGQGRLWLRALLPGASKVELLDALTSRTLVSLQPRGALFESLVPRRRKRFDYRLAVSWADGSQGIYADAYAFGPQLGDADLALLAAGDHPRPFTLLGAHALAQDHVDGVRFAVWAPNARRVSVVGSFNQWDGRRHGMRLHHAAGIWEIFVPHAALGDLYKFEIIAANGELLPLKADPYARAAQLRPDTASIVAALPAARALPPERAAANARQAPLSIYEVHAASWRFGQGGRFASWEELALQLPAYAAGLGFTHLQLMPISEHPFDGSWGYQTLGLYAPTARFGEPEGFAVFVAACHAHGLGLLLDWVPAHFPSDAHGLAQFDGSPLYEYADPREGFHRDWNTLIYNFGRNEVRQFLVGNALYWIERWGVDGLRVDAVASMLYRDYSRAARDWIPNLEGGRENLEAIALLRQMNSRVGSETPGAITVAEESTSFPGVSAPVHAGGLGFHYKWNMGWMNDSLRYIQEDPVHRRWHHDKITFSLVYAFSENFVLPISHDEVVHGKGSMLAKMPGDDWQQFANLRAYYGFMWGWPGKKLLFMGQDFGQRAEWSEERGLDWFQLDEQGFSGGIQRFMADVNAVYRSRPALWSQDSRPEGYSWIDANDSASNVLSFLRWGTDGSVLACVFNFAGAEHGSYRLGLPSAGTWREVLNSDATVYNGSGIGNLGTVHAVENPWHGRPASARLVLPPTSAVWLEPC